MSGKPVKHGADHAPGGFDPIPGAGGGGIQFDTYPQADDWLYVETTGITDGNTTPDGWAMQFVDSGGNGILFDTQYRFKVAAVNRITLDANSGGGVDANLVLNASSGLASISSTSKAEVDTPRFEVAASGTAPSIYMHADNAAGTIGLIASPGVANSQLTLDAASAALQSGTGGMVINVDGGTVFSVDPASALGGFQIQDLSSNPLLQVKWTGAAWEYHGVTGGSWVFDL